MADKDKKTNDKPSEEAERSRNVGRGVPDYDDKNPNPNDIHSDDPQVAGLANGERQARGEGDKGGPVK